MEATMRKLEALMVAVATVVTTEIIFRLSHFEYGMGTIFSQPFDLVAFTVKIAWWCGVWFFYRWAFRRLGFGFAERRRNRENASNPSP
jgi:hypothetical protein